MIRLGLTFFLLRQNEKKKSCHGYLLSCVHEFIGVHRWWVDYLFYVLSVTVCVGRGHMDQNL